MAEAFPETSSVVSKQDKKTVEQEIKFLLNDANGLITIIEQFCTSLETINGTSYTDYFKYAHIDIDIIEESETVSSHKEKLVRQNLYFSVCGGASAGKSTMVNALLGTELIPFSPNRCTPCCILVQTTDERKSYFRVDSEDQQLPLEELKEKADMLRGRRRSSVTYNTINVYVSKREFKSDYLDLQHTRISLMDTPGLDQEAFKKNENVIMASDVFVFVVDSVVGFVDEVKKFFKRVVEQYALKNFLIVFNKWDLVYQDGQDRAKEVEDEYRREAEEFFADLGIRAGDHSNVIDNVFFLSSVHVKLMRQCDSYAKIKNCLKDNIDSTDTDKDADKHSIIVCGGIGKGRSTVVNMLLDEELMPTDAAGTPSFISFERQSEVIADRSTIRVQGDEQVYELDRLEFLGRGDNNNSAASEVNAYLANAHWSEETYSILREHDVRVYDTASPQCPSFVEKAKELMGKRNFTLIIVISARRSKFDNEGTIRDCLRPLQELSLKRANIVLLVNKWDVAIEKSVSHRLQLEEWKKYYNELFLKYCSSFQSDCEKKIFFMSLQNFKRKIKSDIAFRNFYVKLLENGRENFKDTKFEPIFQALENCCFSLTAKSKKLIDDISDRVENLEKIRRLVDEFSFPTEVSTEGELSDAYLESEAKSPVSIFLLHQNQGVELPDTVDALEDIVNNFLNFCDDKYLESQKSKQRERVVRQCTEEKERECLELLFDRANDVAMSSYGLRDLSNLDQKIVDIIVVPETYFSQMRVGWGTLNTAVAKSGMLYGGIFGGFLTTGAFINPNASANNRLLRISAGVTIGGVFGIAVNSLRHCFCSRKESQRKRELQKLLVQYYIYWCRDINMQIKRTVSQFYTGLTQSLTHAKSQVIANKERFERKHNKSKEERPFARK